MLDVLSAGNANVDIVINSKLLRKNAKLSVFPGGSASNFAVACSKLGLNAGFFGFVGRDFFGDMIINNFKKWGVKTFLKRVNKATGIAVVLTKGGFKKMIPYRGANDYLNGANLKPYVHKTKHLHLATPQLNLLEYLKHFNSTSVDPGSSLSAFNFEKLKPYFKHITLFFPNKHEIEHICRCKYVKAAKKILEAGCKVVVVKLGVKGCYAADGIQKIRLKALPNKPIDTTGAGDSFDSAFTAAWLRGSELKEACLHGLASAYKTIHFLGAQNSATTKDISQILEKNIMHF